MTQITSFDRQNLRDLSAAIQAALSNVGTQFNVKLNVGHCKFSPNNAAFKLECATFDSSGTAITKEVSDFALYARSEGLTPGHLGQSFKTFSGETFKLVGYRSKASKKPFIGENAQGKRFIFPAYIVLHGFGFTKPAFGSGAQ